MPEQTFVGREKELFLLRQFLDRADRGEVQFAFLAGEVGAGKTTLVNEFVRRIQDADPTLIAAIGECNAQTGAGDPYLPFRQVLSALTGEPGEAAATKTVSSTNSARLKETRRDVARLMTELRAREIAAAEALEASETSDDA